ncbi:FAD-binding domain-containing protein [Coprinopsis marcescibilis]|uniref:FAD-binding domain-containing protein n=1 Tax=Coprinopsis marcescibilis TaxID=230819 RepID=A0A5C3L865_COPMA|nr:FAD-binding domain-containing protein [Coprinopsis marcescibilis]
MTDLASFTLLIKGDIVTPTHPSYPTAIARWARNAQRPARLVVFPKDAVDVSHCILYAKAQGLVFAVKGGGHNTAGASSAKDGLVVDLSRYMNGVRMDGERRLGYVGGGACWGAVDREGMKYGLATVGGTVSHVRVVQLTLGGGFGWLSGRHGLTIDNLKQATIVTSSGDILTVNATQHPDVFWAIRGGGSNFGVVTEFVFHMHPQRARVFAGELVYVCDAPTPYCDSEGTVVAEVMSATKRWWAKASAPGASGDEAVSHVITLRQGDDGRYQPVVVVFVFWNGTECEGRERFREFYGIEHISDSTGEMPYEEVNTLQDNVFRHGLSYYLRGTTQAGPTRPSTMLKLMHKCLSLSQSHPNSPTGQISASAQPPPMVLFKYIPFRAIDGVPPASTAFNRADGRGLLNVLLMIRWDSSEGDEGKGMLGVSRETAKEFVDIVARQGGADRKEMHGYTNFVPVIRKVTAPIRGERAKKAFGANYARLQDVKGVYDPELFFDRWFPVIPAPR